ncbi:cytochrome c-type biogenesis protein CcmH [Rhodoligotrophos appendicifer]|uniref:c-type cytochrome biogenesis protein CcmI n=1 Tax=Rhodoligotrophos appendicifer TaxID=987056 RepID=UPI001185B8E7|nr:c-type cytochrome biogenesis protein CcmI [Rhodoligotrophos appendicifer]
MGLWILVALLTAIALVAVLWPLVRADAAGPTAADQEVAVYRDQLTEIDQDLGRGQIAPREAEAARTEVARRLIAAADRSQDVRREGPVRPMLLAGLIGVPLLSLAAYLTLGQPLMPGVPHAERMAHALENRDFDALVARVEAHLADNPTDAEGWGVVAPVYLRQGRYADAANAYVRIMSFKGESPDMLTNYGEAATLADGGIVSERAREAFSAALKADPKQAKADFYLGMAEKQDGKTSEALARWEKLIAEAPADAPWRGFVQANIDQTKAPIRSVAGQDAAPALSEGQVEAVTSQDAVSQQAMIRQMVDGLAARLEQDGNDLEGWLRLARARVVLGEAEAAKAALNAAAGRFKDDQAAMARIAEARKALGVEG